MDQIVGGEFAQPEEDSEGSLSAEDSDQYLCKSLAQMEIHARRKTSQVACSQRASQEEQIRAMNEAKRPLASTTVEKSETHARGSDSPVASVNSARVDTTTVVVSEPAPRHILQDLSELSWVDKRSGDVRVLHRTRGGGDSRLGVGSYGLCVSLFDVTTGENFCCKLGRETAYGDNTFKSLA